MNLIIFSGILSSVLVSIICYYRLYKKRLLFDNRYAMTISMTSAMIISLTLSMQYSFISSLPFEATASAMIFLGMMVGIAFGVLVRLHSVLSGISAGVTGGLMGTMVGSVIKNPSLCGLPMDSQRILLVDMAAFTIFGTMILFITMGLILFSLKV
ncbi:hypothetical protein ACOJQI_10250 [Bacillus salacetis]|uniref:hypothetical protein n=1 Tax=Bacillus salacetis TaxID=2315464 RepID=UPI003B9FFF7C